MLGPFAQILLLLTDSLLSTLAIVGALSLLFVASGIFSSTERIKCPFCAERIQPEAIVCPHCRKDLVLDDSNNVNAGHDKRKQGNSRFNKDVKTAIIAEAKGKNGSVAMTETSVIIKHSGAIAFFQHGGASEKEILISQISSIGFKKPVWLEAGYILFTIPGGAQKTGMAQNNTLSQALNNENAVTFDNQQLPDFEAFREKLREKINSLQNRG